MGIVRTGKALIWMLKPGFEQRVILSRTRYEMDLRSGNSHEHAILYAIRMDFNSHGLVGPLLGKELSDSEILDLLRTVGILGEDIVKIAFFVAAIEEHRNNSGAGFRQWIRDFLIRVNHLQPNSASYDPTLAGLTWEQKCQYTLGLELTPNSPADVEDERTNQQVKRQVPAHPNERECLYCKTTFRITRKNQKFCSTTCRQHYHKKGRPSPPQSQPTELLPYGSVMVSRRVWKWIVYMMSTFFALGLVFLAPFWPAKIGGLVLIGLFIFIWTRKEVSHEDPH